MDKQLELKRTKRLALSLLLLAAVTFVVTLFLPPNFYVSGIKAIAEAAMVGALADWFAVVALFRRVPVPFIARHTAIIPRYRSQLRAEHIRVFADSHVKHGSHAIVADRSIQELTRDVDFFEADAVIATGQRTGDSATLDEIDEIRTATALPLLVGSGVTPANVCQILGRTQGVIVASALKVDGVWWNDVDRERVKHFMAVAQAALEQP